MPSNRHFLHEYMSCLTEETFIFVFCLTRALKGQTLRAANNYESAAICLETQVTHRRITALLGLCQLTLKQKGILYKKTKDLTLQ